MQGNYNGLLVDSGSFQTNFFPIHDGFLLRKRIKTLNFAGEQITDLFSEKLEKKSELGIEP